MTQCRAKGAKHHSMVFNEHWFPQRATARNANIANIVYNVKSMKGSNQLCLLTTIPFLTFLHAQIVKSKSRENHPTNNTNKETPKMLLATLLHPT